MHRCIDGIAADLLAAPRCRLAGARSNMRLNINYGSDSNMGSCLMLLWRREEEGKYIMFQDVIESHHALDFIHLLL
jgi:hypothetical protein